LGIFGLLQTIIFGAPRPSQPKFVWGAYWVDGFRQSFFEIFIQAVSAEVTFIIYQSENTLGILEAGFRRTPIVVGGFWRRDLIVWLVHALFVTFKKACEALKLSETRL
jgi:hypothetical protein